MAIERKLWDAPENSQASEQETHRKTNACTHRSTHPIQISVIRSRRLHRDNHALH